MDAGERTPEGADTSHSNGGNWSGLPEPRQCEKAESEPHDESVRASTAEYVRDLKRGFRNKEFETRLGPEGAADLLSRGCGKRGMVFYRLVFRVVRHTTIGRPHPIS